MNTILIRIGFKTTCFPAGGAEVDIHGEMDIESVQDIIDLLGMTVRRLRTQIERSVGEQVDDEIREYQDQPTPPVTE